MLSSQLASILADLLVLTHFAFVLFVVLGLAAVWIGHFRDWGFVRDLRFRLSHLGAIAYVASESLLGIPCPLTDWERGLRIAAGEGAYQGSFIQHWVHKALFYQVEEWVFTTLYVGFFLLVAASFWVVRPGKKKDR